ncbi:Uncharacterized protein AB751O23_BL_00050 [Chlamydiales bacterium SCGC AB-751-O23]|jgi:4-amino-4-deoxychorismate lyase|nr:Uncharacterized protein AB751O23_BL_00050 [Chlamydiales bacterium SCGC AB-751-O23]
MVLMVNGELVKEASISVLHESFLFGKGLFTTIKIQDGSIWYWKEHIKLLKASCVSLGVEFPKISIAQAKELIDQCRAFKGLWRLKLIVLPADNGDEEELRSIMILKKEKALSVKDQTLFLSPSSFTSALSSYKSLAYYDRILLKKLAAENLCDEILNRDGAGNILEGAFSNIFWIKGKICYSPSSELALYFGCTIRSCLKAAKQSGMLIKKGKFLLENLLNSDAVFTCNSMKGVLSVKGLKEGETLHKMKVNSPLKKSFNDYLKRYHQG